MVGLSACETLGRASDQDQTSVARRLLDIVNEHRTVLVRRSCQHGETPNRSLRR